MRGLDHTPRRAAILVLLLVACADPGDGAPPDPTAIQSFDFGPYALGPGEEVTDKCVQISLHNDDYLFVNAVELTTGAGFHHSNWMFVPDHIFPGEDGTFVCDDRNFNEPAAAVFGGVLFAQSTQAPHERQAFPPGVVIRIPPRFKLVTQIHLLNASDQPLAVTPNIQLAPTAAADVTTVLAGISFEDQALGLPPMKRSQFTLDCELGETHRARLGRDPDFKIYYALAHYHELGTGLVVEAVTADGAATEVYSTVARPGDVLGGPIDPPFDMTGFTRLRFSCRFENPRPDVVGWGTGDQEMCVFLAFSDSPYNFGGGVTSIGPPENERDVAGLMTYENPCDVFATDAMH
jgi:hypothetical protein